jgi:hypothetical protein
LCAGFTLQSLKRPQPSQGSRYITQSYKLIPFSWFGVLQSHMTIVDPENWTTR